MRPARMLPSVAPNRLYENEYLDRCVSQFSSADD